MNSKFPPISSRVPVFMHGADYNPDQWLHDPAVVENDNSHIKLANSNLYDGVIMRNSE